jgi:hypothetical protein
VQSKSAPDAEFPERRPGIGNAVGDPIRNPGFQHVRVPIERLKNAAQVRRVNPRTMVLHADLDLWRIAVGLLCDARSWRFLPR